MNLITTFKLMAFATITALIYIHMQMQIVELAYKGKEKERIVHDLMDSNGSLTHQILALKSANNLGQQLLEKNDGLQFMGNDRVMTLSRPATQVAPRASQRTKTKIELPAWNLLSLLSPQEARAWEHQN